MKYRKCRFNWSIKTKTQDRHLFLSLNVQQEFCKIQTCNLRNGQRRAFQEPLFLKKKLMHVLANKNCTNFQRIVGLFVMHSELQRMIFTGLPQRGAQSRIALIFSSVTKCGPFISGMWLFHTQVFRRLIKNWVRIGAKLGTIVCYRDITMSV